MQYSRKATSIIEAIVVLLVVVTGIVGVYQLLTSSQKLATTTGNRIEAIQIARDGLEIITNIRDTNWLLYAADYENCWNVLNYQPGCIGDSSTSSLRIRGTYSGGNRRKILIYKDSTLNRWTVEEHLEAGSWYNYSTNTPGDDFREVFRVGKDLNEFYTQGPGIVEDFRPVYTRDITFDYVDTNGNGTDQVLIDDKIIVTSTVQWSDSSSSQPQKVEMSTVLTNWKAKQ